MGYRDEIIQQKVDRINSINFLFNQDIQKSMDKQSEEYMYDLNDLKIVKTGKEIKEQLFKEVTLKQDIKASMFNELLKCVEDIGEIPKSIATSYSASQYRGKIELPKVYGSDQTYDLFNNTKSEKAEEMYRYNNKVYEYIDLCIEIKKLNTIVNNIEENKKFRLSANMATKIGF